MKKHAIAVLIVLSLMVSGITTAADWNNFAGVYEMTGSGSCIHSEKDFTIASNGWYNANLGGVVYAGTTAWSGSWTFKHGKKGIYSYVMYATVTPPVSQPDPPILGGVRVFSVSEKTFTYEINAFGDITIVTQEGDTIDGSISEDKNTITLFDRLRVKGPGTNPWYKIVCTASRTLTKVSD